MVFLKKICSIITQVIIWICIGEIKIHDKIAIYWIKYSLIGASMGHYKSGLIVIQTSPKLRAVTTLHKKQMKEKREGWDSQS